MSDTLVERMVKMGHIIEIETNPFDKAPLVMITKDSRLFVRADILNQLVSMIENRDAKDQRIHDLEARIRALEERTKNADQAS